MGLTVIHIRTLWDHAGSASQGANLGNLEPTAGTSRGVGGRGVGQLGSLAKFPFCSAAGALAAAWHGRSHRPHWEGHCRDTQPHLIVQRREFPPLAEPWSRELSGKGPGWGRPSGCLLRPLLPLSGSSGFPGCVRILNKKGKARSKLIFQRREEMLFPASYKTGADETDTGAHCPANNAVMGEGRLRKQTPGRRERLIFPPKCVSVHVRVRVCACAGTAPFRPASAPAARS